MTVVVCFNILEGVRNTTKSSVGHDVCCCHDSEDLESEILGCEALKWSG